MTGTYTIVLNPYYTDTGSITVGLAGVPNDVTGSIAIDGPPITVTTTKPAQNAKLTFSAVAGKKVVLSFSASSYSYSGSARIYMPAADGSASTANDYISDQDMSTDSFSDSLSLPVTGTYTIVLDPGYTDTGSITASLKTGS